METLFSNNCFRILLISSVFVLFISCSLINDPNSDKLTADRDAAECIASNISLNTGGAIDQLSDICNMMSENGLKNLHNKYSKTYFVMTKSFNEDTGIWTIHIERERGVDGIVPYAHFTRDYTVKFLNINNMPQKYYISFGDTARTVLFNVIGGTGRHKTRRISQQLDSLSANFTISDAHLPQVKVNGAYYRAATDTIRGFNRVRISQHVMQLSFHDVVIPRNTAVNFTRGISGNVTGTFDATITFIHGTAYAETSIHRDININFGSGKGDISFLSGKVYKADLASGEIYD